MSRRWLVVAALFASTVHADPLPPNEKIEIVRGTLAYVEDGTSVPVFDANAPEAGRTFTKATATVADKGRTIRIAADGCIDSSNSPLEVSASALHARVENMRGLKLHANKQFAKAAERFAAALEADPANPMYATNLLAAQSMGMKLDDADDTISNHSDNNKTWFAWRIAVEPDFANLRHRTIPSALGRTRSKLAIAQVRDNLAVAPDGASARIEYTVQGMGASLEDLVLYNPGHRVLARLPLATASDACIADKNEAQINGLPTCTKAQTAHNQAHERAAADVLDLLGFTAESIAWIDRPDMDRPVLSPDKRTTVKLAGTTLTITRSGKTQTSVLEQIPKRVGFGANHVVIVYAQPAGCSGADAGRSASLVYPQP